jgi:hypothetical protein
VNPRFQHSGPWICPCEVSNTMAIDHGRGILTSVSPLTLCSLARYSNSIGTKNLRSLPPGYLSQKPGRRVLCGNVQQPEESSCLPNKTGNFLPLSKACVRKSSGNDRFHIRALGNHALDSSFLRGSLYDSFCNGRALFVGGRGV